MLIGKSKKSLRKGPQEVQLPFDTKGIFKGEINTIKRMGRGLPEI